MTSKLIIAAVVVALAYCGFHLWKYWEEKKNEEENGPAKVVRELRADDLSGMPYQLGPSLSEAQQKGPAEFRKWLDKYGSTLQDPRKAWIELDFCLAILRDNPAEARKIFADVKARTGPTSKIWPRVKELDASLGSGDTAKPAPK